jgi:hypothetical protein
MLTRLSIGGGDVVDRTGCFVPETWGCLPRTGAASEVAGFVISTVVTGRIFNGDQSLGIRDELFQIQTQFLEFHES